MVEMRTGFRPYVQWDRHDSFPEYLDAIRREVRSDKYLQSIRDATFRDLILGSLEVDPRKRWSAGKCQRCALGVYRPAERMTNITEKSNNAGKSLNNVNTNQSAQVTNQVTNQYNARVGHGIGRGIGREDMDQNGISSFGDETGPRSSEEEMEVVVAVRSRSTGITGITNVSTGIAADGGERDNVGTVLFPSGTHDATRSHSASAQVSPAPTHMIPQVPQGTPQNDGNAQNNGNVKAQNNGNPRNNEAYPFESFIDPLSDPFGAPQPSPIKITKTGGNQLDAGTDPFATSNVSTPLEETRLRNTHGPASAQRTHLRKPPSAKPKQPKPRGTTGTRVRPSQSIDTSDPFGGITVADLKSPQFVNARAIDGAAVSEEFGETVSAAERESGRDASSGKGGKQHVQAAAQARSVERDPATGTATGPATGTATGTATRTAAVGQDYAVPRENEQQFPAQTDAINRDIGSETEDEMNDEENISGEVSVDMSMEMK
jgi:hypothetical protein